MTSDPYATFLQQITQSAQPAHVAIYHAVRNIPYGAVGIRDPLAVIKNHRGSCSGKHLLLRELLRRAGYEAEILTIHTHFNKVIPIASSFPAALARLVKEGHIDDFHHYVRARIDGDWLNLDATWPDSLVDFGFLVNTDWDGAGNTNIAAEAIAEYPAREDIVALKSQLIAELPDEARKKRKEFFDLLSTWMDSAVPQVDFMDKRL